MYHNFLIHSFTDGHLGCFQHLAIVNCTAMNTGVHRFFWIGVSAILGYNPSRELPGQKAVPFLVCWGNSILFSTVAAPFRIPTNSVLGFLFLHILTSPCCLLTWLWWTFWLVWSGIPLWFSFPCLWWLMILSILSYVSGPSVCPTWRNVQVLCPFFNWVVCRPNSSWSGVVCVLYIFWRSNPYLRYHLQKYFPIWLVPFSFCWCFSLAVQKLFILMKSHLFILSFRLLALEDILVKILLCGISEIFLPRFSFRTFMVSQLIFKFFFIHIEFIFVYGVSWWSSFIFLHIAV